MSRNLENLKEIYSAFGEGDFDRALSKMSDDIIWTERMPYAGTRIGNKDEIKDMFARVTENLEWNMDFGEFIDGGDIVVSIGTYGFRTKPFPPGEPLGTARVCHVFWFDDDGLVTRYEQFADTLKGQAIIQAW